MKTKKSATAGSSPAQPCFTHKTLATVHEMETGGFPQHFPWASSAKTAHVLNEGINGGVR